MLVKVIVPNKSYSGAIAGVQFHAGVGVFEDEKLAKKIADQFSFEIESDSKEPEQEETKKPVRRTRKTTKKAGE